MLELVYTGIGLFWWWPAAGLFSWSGIFLDSC